MERPLPLRRPAGGGRRPDAGPSAGGGAVRKERRDEKMDRSGGAGVDAGAGRLRSGLRFRAGPGEGERGAERGERQDPGPLPMGQKALEELAEPSALTVSCGWDQITLSWSGNASWSKAGPDGEGETWIACGLHPPGQSGIPGPLYRHPAGAGQTEGGGVASLAPALTLAFEVQPTQVTLRRWPAEYVGRTQEGRTRRRPWRQRTGPFCSRGRGLRV